MHERCPEVNAERGTLLSSKSKHILNVVVVEMRLLGSVGVLSLGGAWVLKICSTAFTGAFAVTIVSIISYSY